MRQIMKVFTIIFLLLCHISVPAQQLQTIEDTDSLKARREKTNANFQTLRDKLDNNLTILSGKENVLTFGGPLSRTGNNIYCPTCLDTNSPQTLSSKRLNLPEITSYLRSTLPAASSAGRLARVTDDGGLYLDTGTEWVAISDGIRPKILGAKGDGVTNDLVALNKATLASSQTKLPVVLDGGTYKISGALTGTYSDAAITCPTGNCVIKSTGNIMHPDNGKYIGWRFEGVELQGTSFLFSTRNQVFEKVKFQAPSGQYAIMLSGVDGARFIKPKFAGTVAGVMQAGVMDPAPAPSAAYGLGLRIIYGVTNTTVEGGEFNFCNTGIASDGNLNSKSSNLTVRYNDFRASWWNSPYITARITFDSYNPGTKTLTYNAGGLASLFTQNEIISFPVTIATGSSFTANGIGLVGAAFVNPRRGDVIETSDGKRAEILSVPTTTLSGAVSIGASTITVASTEGYPPSGTLRIDSEALAYTSLTGTTFTLSGTAAAAHSSGATVTGTSEVTIARWESIDTFEPVTFTSTSTAWRLVRFYASGTTSATNTTVGLYSDPVNVFTGETLVAGAGLTPTSYPARVYAKTIYAGMHINGGMDGLLVEGNRFYGSWADQISIFHTEAPRVIGNQIWYGQDEGITITDSPRAVVANNTCNGAGVSCVAVSGSDYISVIGNTVNNWGIANRGGVGAFDHNAGIKSVYIGNTAVPAAGANGNGAHYMFRFINGSAAGSLIAGNIDGGATTATLQILSDSGEITGRDLLSVVGTGASNVYGMRSITPILIGSASPASSAQLEVRSKNDAASQFAITDLAGHTRYLAGTSGGFWLGGPSTALSITSNSPAMNFARTFWNGSANVSEAFNIYHVSFSANAANAALWFEDKDGNKSLALGHGGAAAVGYGFPNSPATYGQFHVRSLLTTTPTVGFQRIASQSVDIARFLDESSATLSAVDKDGGFRLRTFTFENLPSSPNGTMFYCSNCVIGATCAGSGTGARATRINGSWACQ